MYRAILFDLGGTLVHVYEPGECGRAGRVPHKRGRLFAKLRL